MAGPAAGPRGRGHGRRPGALASPARFNGLILAFIGVLGLVAGTLWFGRFCRGVPLLPNATAQFVSAALFATLGAWLLESPRASWTADAVAAIAWNTILVSLGGMALYALMLARGSAARASANFYLVPGTAALLAWFFLHEQPSALALAGLLTASAGCWLVQAPRQRQRVIV